MVKRTPPLTLALIGTGETSAKNVEALLTDYTAQHAEVTFLLPADDAHWTPTIAAAHAWATANDIQYVAVTDGKAGKALTEVLTKADSTIKAARISTKMVQLLLQESTEGSDATLIVAWDDDDSECVTAVNKALAAGVKAVNLCDGLDQFEFDDGAESDEPGQPTGNADADRASRDAHTSESEEADDDYEGWGIRKLRAELRERKSDISDRTIGQMEKAEALRVLRMLDAGTQPAAEEDEEDEEDDEAQQPTATTRARRAFAEGAAEGSGETKALPRSKGSDILEDEDDTKDVENLITNPALTVSTAGWVISSYEDLNLRTTALQAAISTGKLGAEAIADALKYETFLRGQRQSAGRPRADGSPAQAREIGEEGRPIRRRRSTE